MTTIAPVSIGAVADPPSLVLIYNCERNHVKKCRRRKMPLRDFSDKSDVVKMAFTVKQRHSEYLQNVHSVTIEKLLRIIQEIIKGLGRSEAIEKVNEEYNIDPEEDLNKVSPKDLMRKKELMEEIYNKSVVRPEDPDFIYDKEVIFDQIVITNPQSKNSTNWDDDETSEAEQQPDKDITEMISLKDSEVATVASEDPANSLKGSEIATVASDVSAGGSDRSRLYEVEDGRDTPEGDSGQYIPLIVSSKIEGRNKSLFEKANPVKLDVDELDDMELGLGDIEIGATETAELDDDDFW